MELWAIIALSVLGTLSVVLFLWAICDVVSERKRKKKRQQEWYMSTLKELMDRMDTVECDINGMMEDIETIAYDIYGEEE